MGRWVTSKGRRIYIPDEGEENPYAKKEQNTLQARNNLRQDIRRYKETHHNPGDIDAKKIAEMEKKLKGMTDESNSRYKSKDEKIKEKQIAENKKQADERNSKTKYYAVYQPTEMFGTKMHTRLERVSARSEHEAVRKYKKSYPKAEDKHISLHRVEKDGKRYQNADGTWDDGHQYIPKKKKRSS